ncbi:MAG: hypothetical protein AAFQ84_04510 [Pseudomonadota bacterium]
MEIAGFQLFAILGFLFAAYAVVANDSIQTLGTFLASNSHRPWWLLWIYAGGIMVAALAHAYFFQDGDIADGKLNALPYPENGIQWWHALPPLVLLFLTRFSIPVSTTFLVLTVFALSGGAETEGVMQSMLIKSALGYVVAFAAGGLIYAAVSRSWEKWVSDTRTERASGAWVVFQWSTTAFLWWTWLKQDFANIFVFLPRTDVAADGASVALFDPLTIVLGGLVLLVMQAYIFATRGGEIQSIVLSKTNTTDVRAATFVDLIYAIVLYIFKEQSDIPMSTTWVFLGLLAGRELAIAYVASLRERREAAFDVGTDAGRALIGLVISVALAIGMPWAATGQLPNF